jgi:hypothetical protein
MKNMNACVRVRELLNETVELLLRIERAPHTPFGPRDPKEHRVMRRLAERLDNGEIQPLFGNLYTGKQLARLFRDTITRDEIREETRDEFFRLAHEIGRCIHEDPPGTRKVFDEFWLETLLASKAGGPGSEGECRWRQLQKLVDFVKSCRFEKRRGRRSKPRPERPSNDGVRRISLVPAVVLPFVPPGETIIPFPAISETAEDDRVLFRIGIGPSSWIGSFEPGTVDVNSVFIMPDGEHLFVSALGAGYRIHLESRTLVERLGNDVVGIHRDPRMTLFLIEHGSGSLEAFGVASRLWKTGPLGAGGLRNIGLCDDQVVGEALQSSGVWTNFSINVVSGEVRVV